jgi:hypothetical protein
MGCGCPLSKVTSVSALTRDSSVRFFFSNGSRAINKDVLLFYFGSTWAEIGESFAHFSVRRIQVRDTESIFCVSWVKNKNKNNVLQGPRYNMQ